MKEHVFAIRHPEWGFLTHFYDGCGGPQLEFTFKTLWGTGYRENPMLHPVWWLKEGDAISWLDWVLYVSERNEDIDSSIKDCVVYKLYGSIYQQGYNEFDRERERVNSNRSLSGNS